MRRPTTEFNLTTQDLEKMFGPSNDLTVKSWEKRWMSNIVENLNVHPNPRPMNQLLTKINKHTSLVCGAGPSLRKLKKRAHLIPSYWGIVVTDHALLAVLEAGIKPTLVCTMDGHQETEPAIIEGFKRLAEEHPDVPVLVDLVACPSVVELIKEPYWFRSCGDPAHILGRYVNRECPHVDRMGHGGNVGSVCAIMAKFFMYSKHVIFIGMDKAMQEGTSRLGYWHGYIMPDEHQYVSVADIYGRPITTMANLHNYKWWLEHFTYTNDDVEWIISNDGGFLGVASASHNFNHWKFATLDEAVEYLHGHDEIDD